MINVLVALRMHFERINYHQNKEPKYLPLEEECYQQYSAEPNGNNTFKKALSEGKKIGIGPRDVLGIYLYSSNQVYGPLNHFLRVDYMKEDAEKDKQYLPMTGWIARSTKKAEPYRGVTWRGVGKIDLKKALNLDKHCPPVEGQDPEYRDKFIIFTNFTSSSKDEKVARNFLNKKESCNSLLKIIVNKGHQIERFSEFEDEKEVLIMPFTYFIINNYNLEGPIQTAELEEIPMPETNSN